MNDEMQWRENIEWQNIWWEQANSSGGGVKRIALFGDSVTRGFRGRLNEKLGVGYAVDICASSSQITDDLLWKEYKFFLECSEWRYSRIVLHTGGQHGHTRRCYDDQDYAELFKKSYSELVQNIVPYCSDILVLSSTPCVEKDKLTEWFVYRNEELRKRNEITKEVADEFHLPYIDIWEPLIMAKYEYNDYIHMKADGNEFIAEYLSKYLE